MIEIEIPKDIRQYDSKLIGPFTARQTVCVVIAAVFAIGGYGLFSGLAGDVRLFASGLLALPALLMGWYKPFGMKLEDFLKTAFISSVLSPKHRLYKTKNIFAENNTPVTKKSNKNKKAKTSVQAFK